MNDGVALYQAILEHPEDDAPRLIYSDWLEEQGQLDRAQFIRVQIELAHAEPYSPKYRKLLARERRFKNQWLTTLRGKVIHAEMQRGFIHHVTMYSKRFALEGDEIFDTEPVRSVKFANLLSQRGNVPIDTLAYCPHLQRLTQIGIAAINSRMLWALLSGQQLTQLRAIGIENAVIDADTVRAIFDHSRFPHLEELSIQLADGWSLEWLENFANSSIIPKLKKLTLWSGANMQAGLQHFLEVAPFRDLTSLRIIDYHLPTLLTTIASRPCYHQLTDIDLALTSVTDDQLSHFCENTAFTKLRRLNLPVNRITPLGIQAILKAEHLRTLYMLNLDASHVTGKSRWKTLLRDWCPEAIIRLM